MRLDSPFIQLPVRFDAARLAEEVMAVPESEWVGHPSGFAGNSALILVSTGGDPRTRICAAGCCRRRRCRACRMCAR